MMDYIKKASILCAICFLLFTFTVASVGAVSTHASQQFAAAGSCNQDVKGIGAGAGAFVFVPWYKYLDCVDGAPSTEGMTILAVVTKIAIAIIELLTRLAGLVALGFLLYGSVQYITSQGEPEGLNHAKSTMINALVGFLIVVLAVSFIQFLGRAIG